MAIKLNFEISGFHNVYSFLSGLLARFSPSCKVRLKNDLGTGTPRGEVRRGLLVNTDDVIGLFIILKLKAAHVLSSSCLPLYIHLHTHTQIHSDLFRLSQRGEIKPF